MNWSFQYSSLLSRSLARCSSQEPGAVKFFLDFDEDGNQHLSMSEFGNAMAAAVQRRYAAGTWPNSCSLVISDNGTMARTIHVA